MKTLTVLIILFCCFCYPALTQTLKTNSSKSSSSAIFKLQTLLGKKSGDTEVTVDEARQLINLPLRVTDDKDHACSLISYSFMYKRRGTVEDENTGKTVPTFTNVGDHFTTTPFPAIWKENLTESLQKDEELYFYDIIIKDPTGRKTIAPELRLKLL